MGEILRHKKTGGLYEVLFRGATVRTSLPLTDYAGVMVVAYNKRNPVSVLVRPAHWIVAGHDVLFDSAQIQTSKPLQNGAEVVVYRAVGGGPVWVRRASEMDDGRFEPADAPQPPSSTPGEVERLVEQLEQAAYNFAFAIGRGPKNGELVELDQRFTDARTALLPHISTAGRGEGAAPDWIIEFVRAAANTVTQTTLPGSALREVAERAFAWAVVAGQSLSAADATNPQDQE